MALTTVNISFISQNRGVYSSDFRPKKLSSRMCLSEFSLQLNRKSWSTPVTGASFSGAKTGLSLSPSDVDDGVGNFPSSTSRIGWTEFSKRVSGEWDGFGAEFSNEGNAIELPESVVPEAYREWEVKVFDWQTQCPTLAEPEQQHFIQYKSIQLLPTVGCEADAATRYSIDERIVGVEDGDGVLNTSTSALAFAYQSSGCYVAVWSKNYKLELEYCLINPQDFESRVRIIQVVRIDEDNTNMLLENIRVFREQWYGPFRNGEQLGGCAIRDSAFASTPPITASQLAGVWQGSKAVATFVIPSPNNAQGIFQELLQEKVQNSVRDGCNEILLPKHLWCSLKQNKDNGENLSEVGWLLDSTHAITSGCIFSSTGKLKEISVALETKGPDDV